MDFSSLYAEILHCQAAGKYRQDSLNAGTSVNRGEIGCQAPFQADIDAAAQIEVLCEGHVPGVDLGIVACCAICLVQPLIIAAVAVYLCPWSERSGNSAIGIKGELAVPGAAADNSGTRA